MFKGILKGLQAVKSVVIVTQDPCQGWAGVPSRERCATS